MFCCAGSDPGLPKCRKRKNDDQERVDQSVGSARATISGIGICKARRWRKEGLRNSGRTNAKASAAKVQPQYPALTINPRMVKGINGYLKSKRASLGRGDWSGECSENVRGLFKAIPQTYSQQFHKNRHKFISRLLREIIESRE